MSNPNPNNPNLMNIFTQVDREVWADLADVAARNGIDKRTVYAFALRHAVRCPEFMDFVKIHAHEPWLQVPLPKCD